MGFFNLFENQEIAEAEQWAKQLISARQELRELQGNKPRSAATLDNKEGWIPADSVREANLQQRIEDLTARLKEKGYNVPEPN